MAPEYAIDGQFSVKSDVFSFGILVLEIVSGKKNKGFYHPNHDLNLIGHVSTKISFNVIVHYFENDNDQNLVTCLRLGSYGNMESHLN